MAQEPPPGSVEGKPESNQPKTAFVGAYIDEDLVKSLQSVADAETRGNRSMVLERYIVQGLLSQGIKLKNFVSGCQTPNPAHG
jgi:hypothetical protein